MIARYCAHLLANFRTRFTWLEFEHISTRRIRATLRCVAPLVIALVLVAIPTMVLAAGAGGNGGTVNNALCSIPGYSATCTAGTTVGSGVSAITDPLGSLGTAAANDVFTYLMTQVSDAALWALDEVSTFVNTQTSPNLNAAWFVSNYATMELIGFMFMVPLVILACVKAAIKGQPGIAVRAGFVYAPLCVLATMVTGSTIELLLEIVDDLCKVIYGQTSANFTTFTTNVGSVLSGHNPLGAPLFVGLISAVAILLFGFIIFIELLIREGAIYIAVFFVPLVLASAVMPDVGLFLVGPRLFKQGTDLLIALIFSKLIIVSVLALTVAGLAADAQAGGFKALLVGAALLGLAAYAPYKLFTMIPAMATVAKGAGGGAVGAGAGMAASMGSGAVYSRVRRDSEARMGMGTQMLSGPGMTSGGSSAKGAGSALTRRAGSSIPSVSVVGRSSQAASSGSIVANSSSGAGNVARAGGGAPASSSPTWKVGKMGRKRK